WYFDYNPVGTTVPNPVTQQCETIHLTWERGSATGPNPTAPYYLQIYTSTFIVPFNIEAGSGTSFDWVVPFIPGTQYQICMFDRNGATGGCQDVYTVISNTTTSSPSCANVTFPAGAMDVTAAVSGGAFSQYGWIPQCSDVSVTPVNGTPPYTLTVAPALRPPLNITSSKRDTIKWTDTLAFGLPFFISLIDSEGNKWSQGPLHSATGDDSCLSSSKSSSTSRTAAIAGGTAIAGLIAGAACTAVGFCVASRVTARRRRGPRYVTSGKSNESILLEPSESQPLNFVSTSSRSTNDMANLPYRVEPFPLSPPPEADASLRPLSSLSPAHGQTLSSSSASQSGVPTESERRTQVYVVHHDGGRAPVTVYTDDGAQITELPPSYMDNHAPTEQRRPRVLPGKPRRSGHTTRDEPPTPGPS
ncbi:hypothetical protein K488DRAFT_58955, partial [Vararia minispora EC-137]